MVLKIAAKITIFEIRGQRIVISLTNCRAQLIAINSPRRYKIYLFIKFKFHGMMIDKFLIRN
jgi:hypothetical protein